MISLTAALLLGRLSSLALCPNVIAFGFLGSAVSMLQRMPRLAVSRHVNMYQAISSGVAQPVIGVGFAIFSWVLLSTHLIDFSLPGNNDLALYSAVAFVAGFSERFGPNLVELIERTSDSRETMSTSRDIGVASEKTRKEVRVAEEAAE